MTVRAWPDVREWLQCNTPSARGMCLNTSMRGYNADPIGVPDASAAVAKTKDLQTSGTPPAGTHVLWDKGSGGHGHSCVSDGDGYAWTVDWKPGLNITRVSISAINSAWGGGSSGLRYRGWSKYYGSQALDVPSSITPGPNPIAPPTPPEPPEDEMPTYTASTTTKGLALPSGTWKTLNISDDGAQSIVSGPVVFDALVQVSASGMEPGHQLGIRFKVVDTKSGSDTKRVSTYPVTEVIGTGGSTDGGISQVGKFGSAAPGWTRRLRVEAMTYDEEVTVTAVQSRVLSW